ncbi:hypothetical protein BH11ARM2_BH11ARM2_26740 [soil metagenome]
MENAPGSLCDSPACPLKTGNATSRYSPCCGVRTKTIEFSPQVEAVNENEFYLVPLRGADEASRIRVRVLNGLGKERGVVPTPYGPALRLDLSSTKEGEVTEFEVETDDAPTRTDLWNPVSSRVRAMRVVTRLPRTVVVPVPAVALFANGREVVEIGLENRGNRTARLGPPQVPYGYESADPADAAGFEIPPGESRSFRVRHRGGGVAVLRLVNDKGEPATEIRLHPALSAGGKTPPGFVVSIDFGTSNTSVYCRETKTGDVAPVFLMGDGKVRRETLLYAPEDIPRHNWRAIDVQGIPEGLLTRNLKGLLRKGDAGAKERVRFYLGAMLRGGIETELAARNPGDARRVEFVFTVPVLDFTEEGPSPEHTAYREALLEAARGAGFEDPQRGWSVSTILEPDGGALDVIDATLGSRAFTDGDRLLVIDVGGGTTDVTFGRIRLSGGRPRLEETQNVSMLVKERQFGGERATEQLGLTWALSDANGLWPPESPDRYVKMADNQAGKVAALVNNLVEEWVAPALKAEAFKWNSLAESERNAEGRPPKSWPERFPFLFPKIRDAKHHLSDEGLRLGDRLYMAQPYQFGPNGGTDDSWAVPYDLLEEATRRSIQEIVDGVRDFLTVRGVPPQSVRQVATIGGSARLPGLLRQLTGLFAPASLIPLGDYVDVAVCRGASRIYQNPPPLLPVGFDLSIGGERQTLAAPGVSLARSKSRVQEVTATDRPVPVEIDMVTPDGDRIPFLRYDVSDYKGDVTVELTPTSLRLRLDPPTPSVNEVTVPLS